MRELDAQELQEKIAELEKQMQRQQKIIEIVVEYLMTLREIRHFLFSAI